ncbi:MAG: hypothetical protein ABC536_07115 [Candidatus Methanosuratincola petrocarbonis]
MSQAQPQAPPQEAQTRPHSPYPMNEQQFEAACDYIFYDKVSLLIAIAGIKKLPAYFRRLMLVKPDVAIKVLSQVAAQSPNTAKLVLLWASKAVEPPNINISSLLSPPMGGGVMETIPTNLRTGDRKPSTAPVQPYENRSLAGGGNR